ncbi:HindVP family restriction endonuclease [Telluribacter sp. SYSU D00476]|uniref:HindVP family restriction endonuclease n=1 Tax=Telluribacter sp. SYSU D00476 TaxID=2811430 RepID=UPI001FF215C8|nr:HindVP family restriction endonuclease [Telluribacter sp. SYSU D00476]
MPSLSHTPGLFGLRYSNRDFTNKDNWGKNQFNSSFPAALAAFLESSGHKNVYLKLNDRHRVYHDLISTTDLYGVNPLSDEIFYSFESPFTPFQQLVIGHFPRVDLVTMSRTSGQCFRGIEVKLTALPDNTTCSLNEDQFGCELVIRPDTIVYLACSIAAHFKNDLVNLRTLIGDGFDAIEDWQEGINILASVSKMAAAIDRIATTILDRQEPLVMQPIWKTEGKSPRLCENCLDVFVWSNLAFAQLFLDVARKEIHTQRTITRQVRTAVWLFKMLYDFSITGQIDHRKVIDGLSYDTKNDKAFAVSGQITHTYMKGDVLTRPRITKNQIKDIILGGGQNLLSPERRFDAIIFNSPELFA